MIEADEDSFPVKLHGGNYVWLKNPDGSGALAYPDHVDKTGNVKFQHALSESFAHVMRDGTIMRYGSQIGTRGDLIFPPAQSKTEAG